MKKDGKEVENNSKSRLSLEKTHHAAHKGSFAFWKPFSLEDSSDGRKFKEELRDNTHQNLPKIKLGNHKLMQVMSTSHPFPSFQK